VRVQVWGRGARAARGFTLIELMIVVVIIAIVAVLAIPSMSRAQVDRRVYTDAGYVAELFRMARTRAVGRGAAVLVDMVSTQSNGGGTFKIYEAVGPNPSGNGANEVPVSTCKSPTVWPGATGTATANYVDGVDLGGAFEKQNNIATQLKDPTGAAVADGAHAYLCFTPGGRVYYKASTPTFDTATPLSGAIQIDVQRFATAFGTPVGLTRTVWVASTGSTRIASH
jgi:type IV fimbrial biogenesis protein FimT